jgi:NAD(P)-dependent dehydrogenase (short-subunit alcohol dehydrogenase family)
MPTSPTIQKLFDLTGRVFLVTGGARTLGRDMATALCEAGADGVITSRSEASAVQAAAELAAATGRRVLGLALDVTVETSVQAALARVHEAFGGLDILVNNAGGGGGGTTHSPKLEERPREAWDTVQAANVTATFLLCKHAAPLMRERGGGSIINIASIAGIVGRDRRVYPPEMRPQTIDYAAAKGAVIAMTRDLAAYLGGDGIRVNVISPGGFERGQPAEFIRAYGDKTPLRRMGRDGVDLKGAVVYLASDAAAYVTGHNLVVDGGFSIWQ